MKIVKAIPPYIYKTFFRHYASTFAHVSYGSSYFEQSV